jgi:hypothetical protein
VELGRRRGVLLACRGQGGVGVVLWGDVLGVVSWGSGEGG